MTISEKVSYLKGLADGLQLDENNKQDKLIKGIIDILGDMALSISDLEENYGEICEQLDAVDEDLSHLEDDYYDDDEDEDEDSDDDFYEVECPSCGNTLYLDEDAVDAGCMNCPNCGTELEFDFSADDGDEEKNHEHKHHSGEGSEE